MMMMVIFHNIEINEEYNKLIDNVIIEQKSDTKESRRRARKTK